MKVIRRFFSFFPLLFVAGTIALLLFINLSGVEKKGYLSKFFFSSVTIDQEYVWTMYNLCVRSANGKLKCGRNRAAFPYSPARNFKGQSFDIPAVFLRREAFFYNTLRAAYALYLIALIFSVLALIPVMKIAIKGKAKGFVTQFVTLMAFLTALIASVIQSIVHIEGCNAFHQLNYRAKIGVPMFICMWVSVFALLVSFISVVCLREKAKVLKIYSSESDEKMLK